MALSFQPWQTVAEPAFWGDLGDFKLQRLQLEEGPAPLTAAYTPCNHQSVPGTLRITSSSLETASPEQELTPAPPAQPGTCAVDGELFCLNTVERLASFDRGAACRRAAAAIWAAIQSGDAERQPALLQRLVLLVYCDLKRYRYHHWFAFPTLQPPQPFTSAHPPVALSAHPQLAPSLLPILEACEACIAAAASAGTAAPPLWLVAVGSAPEDVSLHALTEWAAVQAAGRHIVMAALEPSNADACPGWALNNALLMAAARWGPGTLRLLRLRRRGGHFNADATLVADITLPQLPPGFSPGVNAGWLGDVAGVERPRIADLGPSMDPLQLAESAVDLNLLLMRWRAAPGLDLALVSGARCLLLGAGTLGCSVARALLGWGVRRLTFVDNSRVAFSNPVRQSLFTFQDCLDGGRPKAAAAAEAVQAVFPGVEVTGMELTIPMPGHPPAAEAEGQQLQRDAEALDELVRSHDVLFLLLDTREARWLPTLLAAAHNKLAITAALGFEGFVVMRHGVGPCSGQAAPKEQQQQQQQDVDMEGANADITQVGTSVGGMQEGAAAGPRLGCYFCSDVVAPANSTRDRTLDQQCTVARPGLSGIAGSLAAELMAATLTHPAGMAAMPPGMPGAPLGTAAAEEEEEKEEEIEALDPAPLGDPPHMIRGQLTGFSQICLTGQAFSQCPACCPTVVEAYRQRGANFVLQAVSEGGYLEDLTGLTELHQAAEAAAAELEEAEALDAAGRGEDSEDWEEL